MKKQEVYNMVEQLLANVQFDAKDQIQLRGEKAVYGDTFKMKEAIKQLGGKWSSRKYEWSFSSKSKAEILVEIAKKKIAIVDEEQYQQQQAEKAAKRESDIIELINEYAMTSEQESEFRALIDIRSKHSRWRSMGFRGMAKEFLELIASQRDPEIIRAEEEEIAAKELEEQARQLEIAEANRVLEEARRRNEENRILKEAETYKKSVVFEKLIGVDPSLLMEQINDAMQLISKSKRKGFMLSADKQTFRCIQCEVGEVIEKLNENNLCNAALVEFYEHNDNRLDKINVKQFQLNDLVSTSAIDQR